MTRSTSTILSLAFVVVFGVSSMALYSKIMQHGTRLENVISVQEAARQALAKQLREEATHHQGKHATELGALEEKVRLLTEQLDALKTEVSAAATKEAQQVTAVAALEREAAKAAQLATDQAGQIATLEASHARINTSLDQALAPLAAKVAAVEAGQQTMATSTSELAAQANETMTLLQALAEEVGSAKEESAALIATHEQMGRALTGQVRLRVRLRLRLRARPLQA